VPKLLPGVFLTAEWRYLAILNYKVKPEILKPLTPAGTELDQCNGSTFVSAVGFLFLNTRVLGISVPFHRDFEEVNLRFYVRRKASDGWRRGVVFIKELVPRRAIALVARNLYNENYVALPMSHRVESLAVGSEEFYRVSYGWRLHGQENHIKLVTRGQPSDSVGGSEEEFITEHYWGYSAQKNGGTVEYHVDHPRWRVSRAQEAVLDCDVAALYGEQFADYLSTPPSSAFLAEGSNVKVYRGSRI
jgi:uncharacterized protein